MDREVSRRVLSLRETIMTHAGEGVIEAVPGIASLTVHFDPDRRDAADLSSRITALALDDARNLPRQPSRLWTLPACYDGELALDLDEVSARCGLATDEVIRRHAGRYFHVYMLGFLPGFPYMGDLDAALELPRRSNPRVAVPAGAVAIAGAMTAVYPAESPGGWHIIARTPVLLFDVAANPPSILAPGDGVRFKSVSREDFDQIAEQVRAGTWRLAPDAEAA